MQAIFLIIAIAIGGAIAWLDSRPNWDDTAVTAALIFITAAMFGGINPKRPWLFAIAVGSWIPLIGIITAGNTASLLALVFAFLGAYAGMLIRSTIFAPDPVVPHQPI